MPTKKRPPAIIVVQPALPSYRMDLFNRMASTFGGRFRVYSSPTDMGALTQHAGMPAWGFSIGKMHRILGRAEWQSGALSIPVTAGDIVVVCGAPRCITNLLLLVKARLLGARTIWWGHYWSSTSRKWRHLVRMKLMRVSHVQLFYTDAEVREYHDLLGGRPAGRVSALNNGIDTSRIQELRQPYIAEERPRDIFFIGRLEPKARVDELLQALTLPEMSEISLHAIGDGSCGQALRQLAGRLGVSDRVHWHRSTTDEGYIAAVANRCRLFVYPGEVGLSLIHSMAYGLPSVVHSDRWTHMPEISAFEDGQTGRAFVPGSINSLSRTIADVISSPEDLQRFSNACLKTTSADYNTASMAVRFAETIRLLETATERG